MKYFLKLFAICLVLPMFIGSSIAQDYLWPTDASNYLTSSFAEYRQGRFHAGIDIKTWGQIGYRVFAIRDGYIMRVMTSPFGYGKVIYQKLDTGEIVVYAHLDRFNSELEKFVKQEQKRRNAYRINVTLDPSQFPVRRGDLIGYTGDTGTGSPHLHFEIRDRNNNPTNPFLFGYKIVDTIPPKVSAISITPLDVYSRVNSDIIPFIEKPDQISSGNYRLSSIPLVSGKIGFAVDCFDQADGVDNTFAVYKLDFYVDGELQFSATYNKFSYDLSHLIHWDRDYRLLSRGKGKFQKLYKEKYNALTFYKPLGSEIGILNCDPELQSDSDEHGQLSEGLHQFRIELYDFFGNRTTISGNFIVGARKNISASYRYETPHLYISDIRDNYGSTILNPEIYVSNNYGRIWRKMALTTKRAHQDDDSFLRDEYLLSPIRPLTIIKILAQDQNWGFSSFPSFHLLTPDSMTDDSVPELRLEKDFYDDYFRLQLTADGVIWNSPEITVQQIGLPTTQISLWQNDFNEFVGIYSFIPQRNGPLAIEVRAKNLAGQELAYWDQFEIQTVSPQRGGTIAAKDGKCRINFDSGSVYKNAFLRLNSLDLSIEPKYERVGEVYEIFPQDVLFKKSGRLELQYPASDSLPGKLGIYRKTKRGWGFVGNKIDFNRRVVSSQVSSLGMFTLIRDTVPPVLSIRHPQNRAIIRENTPKLLAVVYDTLSGIADERSIIMKLDGRIVIAEYDPEARTIKYVPDDPLSPGEHTISVSASDNCKNEVSVSHKFTIIN